MARRRKSQVDDSPAGFDMTPMIDVTFQLLIFFMLSMSWKEVEGRLVSHLPQDQGLMSSPSNQPPETVRIVLCLDNNWSQHTANKGRHDRVGREWPTMTMVYFYVQRNFMGNAELLDGDITPDIDALYDRIAVAAQAMRQQLSGAEIAPIEIDADSEVPTQHVVGILNALHRAGEEQNIKYAGNPRLNRYFGE